ncbi:MAG: hypothetical protein HY696_08740 [Deltaproteobacteria bacterium]|nr:hypothetical protein [Deltaproteobacteria bacterium]
MACPLRIRALCVVTLVGIAATGRGEGRLPVGPALLVTPTSVEGVGPAATNPSPTTAPTEPPTATVTPATSDDAAADTVTPPPSCGAAPMRTVQSCDEGGGFLCVDSPAAGTTAGTVLVTGRVSRHEHAFAGLHVVAQHDPTKQLMPVDTAHAVQADGRFQFSVPLPQLGDYTIVVQALRVSGAPSVERVQISRVVAPQPLRAGVQLTPDPKATQGEIAAESVQLHLDLLPDCEQCDLLGSRTGATAVFVTNVITDVDGHTRRIERQTDLGSDGQYNLCIPVAPGSNRVAIATCNAATGADRAHCPQAPPVTFTVRDPRPRITLLEPLGSFTTILEAKTTPRVAFAARIENLAPSTTGSCDDRVTLHWNRAAPVALCAGSDGIYRAQLKPHTGINLGRVRVRYGAQELAEQAFAVAWGELHSPWGADGRLLANDAWWYRDALTIGVRQEFMAQTVREVVNHVAASDRFERFLQGLLDVNGGAPAAESATAAHLSQQMATIQQGICPWTASGGDHHMTMQLVEPPQIGGFEITRITFAQDEMRFEITVRDLKILARYFRDDNRDGQPDEAIIPLKIAFQHLLLYPKIRLERGERPRVLLTADSTDCDYLGDTYCRHAPAVVIPQNFIGAATAARGFVTCDHTEQAVSEEVAALCHGLNVTNAQTGLLSQSVLDALNDAFYCNGSAALTLLFRESASDLDLQAGCGNTAPSDDQRAAPVPGIMPLQLSQCPAPDAHALFANRSLRLPVGLDLVHSVLQLNSQGMSARIATRIGNESFFNALPPDVRQSTFGYLTDVGDPHLPLDLGLAGARDLTFGVGESLLNQILFGLSLQAEGHGPLDWDLSQVFYERLGIDLVAQCDAAEQPSSLCYLRPTVKDLFGTALTSYGYFTPRHPVLLRLRGSRRVAPHVRFYPTDLALPVMESGQPAGSRRAQVIELQIPDLEMGFYALETDPSRGTDQYGNPVLRLDPDGQPIIYSMRPEQSDPHAGAIIRARATLFLAFELGTLLPDPDDPSHVVVRLKTLPTLTRLSFAAEPGSNSTLVPERRILSQLEEIIKTGITGFSEEQSAIPIRLPKRFDFSANVEDNILSALLGITQLRFAHDGISIGVDQGQDFFSFGANLSLTQRLPVAGQMQEWRIPRE